MSSITAFSPVLWCLGAFLCGSIPFGLLLVKLSGKGDVRAHGSGNIGATNVSRVGGKALGVITLLLDILKGFLPVFVARKCGVGADLLALMALAAVLGHVFTPWLKFHGGKGVATALGVILATQAQWIILPMGVFILVLWLTRHVSLGSILAAAMVPAQLLLPCWMPGFPRTAFSSILPWLALVVLVIWKHRDNIRRLQAGTESKLWGAKQEESHVQG
jgi:glycerol-3-phosphate acyltransferase PlsY